MPVRAALRASKLHASGGVKPRKDPAGGERIRWLTTTVFLLARQATGSLQLGSGEAHNRTARGRLSVFPLHRTDQFGFDQSLDNLSAQA